MLSRIRAGIGRIVALADGILLVLGRPLATPGGRRVATLLVYVLTVLSGIFLAAIWQVGGALSQMHEPGRVSINAFGFSISADRGDLAELRNSWCDYLTAVDNPGGDITRRVAPPQDLVTCLFLLDSMFVVFYLLLFSMLLVLACQELRDRRERLPAEDRKHALADTGMGMARFAFLALVALALVDFLENVALWGAYVRGWDWVATQPCLSSPSAGHSCR